MDIVIKGTKREETGKGYARRIRSEGKVPANIIGKGQSTPIEIDSKLLSKAWKMNERKFELDLDSQKKTVLIKELQLEPVKRVALHVDLMYV